MELKWEVESCVSQEKELNFESMRDSQYPSSKATDSHDEVTGKH
jgi:hypothetical protein